ncbi:hypothetical protein FCM44_03295 [Mycoplasma bovis]|uniref:Uncharacterized protein n=1 Tax=Mycoplasmopsis bovis (strain ATCC 25523 / DSM 22781 / NCTC 10131 / PG45) TaxID=289397 RepID=A0A454APW4_MYCBG|nr:conserved hypothetical protein (ICEB-2 encoded) [Mycoplasmopsis bovis PG45]AXJ70893.1 hypothetical protein CH320_02780 [Mycoplasmopsis bovis]AXJ71085.1 hypothetical protein CH320_03930 [Mycoplasmopsis bovis]AXJ71614.1 hypothetical protein CH316_02100 [Mycoplasmopsis bovis]AXJ71747.1 hypothetical protein CH316_02875 [Mycoplasmopsis bovis]
MRKVSKKASVAILVTYIVLQVALIWFLLLCLSYWQYLVQQGALTTTKFNLLIGAVILYISLALIYPIWWFKKHKKKQRR